MVLTGDDGDHGDDLSVQRRDLAIHDDRSIHDTPVEAAGSSSPLSPSSPAPTPRRAISVDLSDLDPVELDRLLVDQEQRERSARRKRVFVLKAITKHKGQGRRDLKRTKFR